MELTLKFLGAADTVTGSRTLLSYHGKKWLIDCGLFQGDKTQRLRNWEDFPLDPVTLSGVLLTHAHLDHSGYLPRLCRAGFNGQVHVTDGTADLCRILLLDAAHLEEEAAAYANRTGYSHHKPAKPLFTTSDAEVALTHLVRHPRDAWMPLAEGLNYRFIRAGHIIGASYIQFAAETAKGTRVLTFSGDIGNGRSVVMKAPELLRGSDALVLESTYGDRSQPRCDTREMLAAVASRTFARGGVLVIPAFAVGRAQEITYLLHLLEKQGRIPAVPVILDSPMAASAMDICLAHPDDQVLGSAFSGGVDAAEALKPRLFQVTESPDQSMLACMRDGPAVVISAAGMLNGGRILQHLRSRLGDARNTVLFSGYQAAGTKGRFLQDCGLGVQHAASLRIYHQEVPIAAEITTLDCLSSHADWEDTLTWLGRMERLPKRIFINHGEPSSQLGLAARIKERFGIVAEPCCGSDSFSLWD